MTCAYTPTNTMGSLRFPAVLMVLLYTTVAQTSKEEIQMGMFPEAADYSFQNCRKDMLEMVTKSGGLLQTELDNNPDFKTMWQDQACSKTIPGATPEHMKALQSYVEASAEFHKRFEKLLRTSRGTSTYQEFPFKSLFFLLTDAMQLTGKNNCRTVYSGSEKEYKTKIGEKVQFASFFPARFQYTLAIEDANVNKNTGTVFNITSCSVISLEDYGCDSEEIDILISPTEVFTVTDNRTDDKSSDEFKLITLKHFEMHSSSNCSSRVSLPEESKESSSSFLSSSLLNLMASLLVLYYYTLAL